MAAKSRVLLLNLPNFRSPEDISRECEKLYDLFHDLEKSMGDKSGPDLRRFVGEMSEHDLENFPCEKAEVLLRKEAFETYEKQRQETLLAAMPTRRSARLSSSHHDDGLTIKPESRVSRLPSSSREKAP
jgi:hypothetical protein